MIPVQEAERYVLERIAPLAPVEVELGAALGAVVAGHVAAAETVPAFASSAMDGYAVRASDTVDAPIRLPVVGVVAAGRVTGLRVMDGQAVRIMTGAPVPDGADAVVPFEMTTPADGTVVVEQPMAAGASIRAAGEDVHAGEIVVPAGTVVTPAHIGLLANVGIHRVAVVRRPRVGVLSTGDELVSAGPLGPGQIRDSNRHMLLALVRQGGFEPVDLGVVGDDEAAVTKAVEKGVASCDAMLTTGGVSVGDFDPVKAVLDRLGSLRWMQVAIKPGKPFAFAVVDGVPVFGHPGNPVAAAVSFELFARPALRRMAGHTVLHRPVVQARASERLSRRTDGKVHFLRAVAAYHDDTGWTVRSAGRQGSHQLTALAAANALAVLPDGESAVAGAAVETMILEEGFR